MSKVDGSIGSLVQGVSQQPPRARRPGQAEEQLNVRNDEVFGLSRRAPTRMLAPLTGFETDGWENSNKGFVQDSAGDTVFWYTKGDVLRLYNPTTGAVLLDTTSSYLPTGGEDVRVISLENQIMVLNTAKTVAMDTGATQDYANDRGAVVYTRGGATATTFTLTITDDIDTIRVYMKTDDNNADQITSEWIITRLEGLLDGTLLHNGADLWISAAGAAHIAANYTVTRHADHLLILSNADINARVVATDGTGTNLLQAIQTDVSEVGRLPIRARHNQVVLIRGDASSDDDYFVRFETETGSTGDFADVPGTWIECASPDTYFRIDAATMPHVVTRSGSTYTFQEHTWEDKKAGDDDSNPDPTFVGGPIADFVSFQERLILLHGAELSGSQTEETSNFFLQSATGTLDNDPINVRPTTGRRTPRMRSAVPSDRDLVLFADDNAQYLLSGRGRIAPDTVAVPLTAEFGVNTAVVPESVGNAILYANTRGDFTEVLEMFLLGQDDSHGNRSVSAHVPKYIPANITDILADEGQSFAMLWDGSVTAGAAPYTQEVFLYEYLWQDNKRVQSAWSKNTYHDQLVAAYLDGTDLLLVFYQDDSLPAYAARVDLSNSLEGGLDFDVHLDRRGAHSTPAFTLPTTDTEYVAIRTGADPLAGLPAVLTRGTDVGDGTTNYTIPADASDVLVGIPYPTRLVPTMPVIRDRAGVARAKSDLAVARFKIDTVDTGPFRMTRETVYEDPADWWYLDWEGFYWDDPDFQLGAVPMDSGVIEFTFEENAATAKLAIDTSSYLPMNITEIEWLGSLRGRSTRVNTGG